MTETPAEPHLQGLNPEQLRAARTIDGPVLVLAGAGSGKTGVLTRRIAHMLHVGIAPENILAVTFTNKAAGEMKERVVKLTGEPGEAVWISTFHSSCARILRQEIEALGWTKRFAIYDDDDQLRIVKDIVAAQGYDPERVSPRDLLAQIDHHKNRTVGTPDELVNQRRSHINDPLVRVWREYEERLKAADAVDFNDLIRLVVVLWKQNPGILEKYQEKWHYLLVDEYQDTNHGQYQLLRMLAAKRRNLMVVGDDDQSIYGFRGADISNILGFERDFPDATVVKLERNYRCTPNILAVANTVVAQNKERMQKRLWTEGDAGHKVTFIAVETAREEAERVARATHKLRRHGYQFGDMAIIYRTNATSRIFEAALRDLGVPYRIVGGRKFYERREIRDVLSYLRLVVNPADDAAFLRVVNVPSRGIGPKTLSALRDEAAQRGEPLLKTARGRSPKDPHSKGLVAFVGLMDELTEAARLEEPQGLVLRVLDRTGYQAMLDASGNPEDKERLENLGQLVEDATSQEYPPEALTATDRLRAWLDRVALTGQDEEIPDGGMVTLMTVHNAKGLEYPVVFVVHAMEGWFPHSKSQETPEDVEEERRLAYVAFTRAKKRLVITRSRTVPSAPRPDAPNLPLAPRRVEPSRFLYGLPAEVCEGDLPSGDPTELEEAPAATLEEVQKRKLRALISHHQESTRREAALPEGVTLVELEDPSELKRGDRIHHPRHGVGVVCGRHGAAALLVSFGGKTRSIPLNGGPFHLVRDA
jgi:DNA helicase-2/ATP-dependent DNA helicase PcrA